MSGIGDVGKICKFAAPIVSMVCPGLGMAMGIGGSIASKVDDSKSEDKTAKKEDLGLANMIAGNAGSTVGIDPTKMVSIFGV